MNTLKTDRLILRNFKFSDLDDFYEYTRNPNIGPNAGWPPHKSKEESLKVLQEFIERGEVWAIVLKDNKKLIGSIGLHKDPIRNVENVKMIGYVLSQEYWGKGIMPEAVKEILRYGFEELDLALVSVQHYPFNHNSKRVIEKCGFQYEGTLRHANQIYNGTVYDTLCYSMKKEDWYVSQFYC